MNSGKHLNQTSNVDLMQHRILDQLTLVHHDTRTMASHVLCDVNGDDNTERDISDWAWLDEGIWNQPTESHTREAGDLRMKPQQGHMRKFMAPI